MSLLSRVEGLEKPRLDITVAGAGFELDFVPGVNTTINPIGGGGPFTVTAVDVTLTEGGDPTLVTVTVV